MNRVTAVLLAAGALLVYVLALYRDASGGAAPPFEGAFAAYRLARNLVHDGVLAWDPATGAGGLASHPSPLLVALAWCAERAYLSVTKVTQLAGIVCALGTVAVSTRFDKERIAGVVPALLLVSCGALAVAGASGTEWAPFTFLLVTAFVAQEHRRPLVLAAAVALLVAARPEGALVAALLALQALLTRAPRLLLSYVPAAVTWAGLAALGAGQAALLADALTPDAARARAGGAALWDFLRTTGSPFLLVVPLGALLLGELSGVGRRALAVALLWALVVALEGGGPWAMQLAFVPALPLAFIAIEQGIARTLDTFRPSLERLAWVAIGGAVGLSVLLSRFPGDIGPLGLDGFYARWLAPAARPPLGYPNVIGRASLHNELNLTQEARRIGAFLRDHVPADATVLTPWPGVIGYISRARVIDLYGRTAPLVPGERCAPWWPTWRPAPVRAALALAPDYILPGLAPPSLRGGLPAVLTRAMLAPEDAHDPGYELAVRAALAEYELVACAYVADPRDRRPVFLLRRKDPRSLPTLELAREGDAVRVRVRVPELGPPLYARLELRAVLADGGEAWWPPDGGAPRAEPCVARGTFVLEPVAPDAGTSRPTVLDLGRFALPPGARGAQGRLVLPWHGEARPLPLGAAVELPTGPEKPPR